VYDLNNPKLNSLSKFSTEVTSLDFIEMFLLFLKNHTNGQDENQKRFSQNTLVSSNSYRAHTEHVQSTYKRRVPQFSVLECSSKVSCNVAG